MLSRTWRCYRIPVTQAHLRTVSSSFKSKISLDNLYPDSTADYSNSFVLTKANEGVDSDEFSGYIPIEKLDISYSKGSGPGGQHVNKVNTKVEIRCHINSADWIPEWIKPKLIEQQSHKVTKDGVLIVTSDKTRKQLLNQADCLDKLRTMVRRAGYISVAPTEEDIQLREKRLARRKKQILTEKRNHSLKKASRNVSGY